MLRSVLRLRRGTRRTSRRCRPVGIVAHAGFDHREPVDNITDGVVDRFERFLVAADFPDDFLRCRRGRSRARNAATGLDFQQVAHQLLHAALDGIEIAEPRFRCFELLHQLGDTRIQLTDIRAFVARRTQAFDLVAERTHHVVDVRRRITPTARTQLFDGVRDIRDAAFKRAQDVVALRTAARVLIDALGKCTHFVCQSGQRVVRRDVRNDAAQSGNRGFEMFERGGILLMAACHLVDLARERMNGVDRTRKIFSRRQSAQRVANFGQPLLQRRQCRAVRAATAAGIDARGQHADFAFERFDGAARRGFGQGARDVGEIVAQCTERIVHSAGAERIDLVGDVTQLVFDAGEVVPRELFTDARFRRDRTRTPRRNFAIQLTLAH